MKRRLVSLLTAIPMLLGVAGCLTSEAEQASSSDTRAVDSGPATSAAAPPASGGSESGTACSVSGAGEAAELALGRCLAGPPLERSSAQRPSPVVLYLDRSASMRGFLDPEYPTRVRTDYRSVLDGVVVGLRPQTAYSYGTAVRPVDPTLGVVGNKAFYTDRNTQLEEVVARVERDTAAAVTHVIIGDGRRGSPDLANGQFVAMRSAADAWTARGGTLLVAASMAPFKTVALDPSGCRVSASSDRCPLYAFAYVAPGDEVRIASALAGVFEHIFAWRMPVLPAGSLVLDGPTGRADLRLERGWARASDGTPIARVRGPVATNELLRAAIRLADTASLSGRTYAALLQGHDVTLDLASRPLHPSSLSREWSQMGERAALVRPSASMPLGLDFVTRGAEAPRSIVRVDLVSLGRPTWLEAFDATDANDLVRTYGIGRLFESSRQAAERQAHRMGRLYVVVN